MWFIGVEVEQEMSAPPPKKKSWIRPCILLLLHRILTFFVLSNLLHATINE